MLSKEAYSCLGTQYATAHWVFQQAPAQKLRKYNDFAPKYTDSLATARCRQCKGFFTLDFSQKGTSLMWILRH